MPELEVRELSDIAYDIKRCWPKIHYTALPYLEAMYGLRSINDQYGCDSARDIVVRFLSNASKFSGEDARRLKNELKRRLI